MTAAHSKAPGRDAAPGRGLRASSPWIGLLVTFALALVVRLVYVFQIRGTPLTDVLLIDSDTYDRFARRMLAGNFGGEDIYAMNWLYPGFVALIYKLAGAAPFAVLVVQAVMSAVNAALVHLVGRRLFDPATAWVAGIAAALYAPYVFYSGALLTPTVIESCLLTALAALAAWRAERRTWALIVAGVAIGLAALGRGNALMLVVLLPFFFRIETGAWRRALRPWATCAAGALALAGFATLVNARAEGRFVPISANYAAFYLGHGDHANGLYVMPPFVNSADFESEVTGVREALSREVGRPLTQAEASGELFQRGLRWVAAKPGAELRLVARKFYYFWNRTESPTNLSFDFAREFSGLLRALPLGFGLVAPLGIAGMIAARRRWREWLVLGLALIVPLATCLLFFVSAEYRLPAAAVLILFAANGVTACMRLLFGGRTARRATKAAPAAAAGRSRDGWIALALLPLFAIGCNVRDHLLRAQSANRVAFYNHGVLYQQRGQSEKAEAMLRRSLAIDPNFEMALTALARLEHRRGNTGAALHWAERASRSNAAAGGSGQPASEVDRLRVAAEQFYQAKRYAEALPAFARARAAALASGDREAATSAANNTGLTLHKLGRLPEAERALREIVAEQPAYVRAHTNLALVLEAQGRAAEALAEYRRALEIEPGNIRAQRAVARLGAGGK